MSDDKKPFKCTKRCYRNRHDAKKYIKETNRAACLEFKLTGSYYCDMCKAYHVTSMPKQKSRDFGRFLKNKEK